jgi:hypothetical protein
VRFLFGFVIFSKFSIEKRNRTFLTFIVLKSLLNSIQPYENIWKSRIDFRGYNNIVVFSKMQDENT